DVATVADEAIARLAPAEVAWGEDQADFGVNRRNNPEKDVPRLRAEDKLKGPIDHSTPVLRVRDETGKLVAAVFGYACHATVLADQHWSGDYPGYAQRTFEAKHPGTVAMFWAGCGADINPLPRRKVELAEAYGAKLADAVDRALAGEMRAL